MTGKFSFENRSHLVVYLFLSTPLAVLLGIAVGKFFLPWVQAAAVFPLYLHTLARGEWKLTSFLMAGWAILVAVLVGVLTFYEPAIMEDHILHAGAYKKEMFHWISTGIGPEGDIQQFLPQHLLHLLTFVVLTLISGGFLGLVMGSSLMNYMSFYVGSLLAEAESSFGVLVLAWPPWAVSRVAGFILIAMVLSLLVLRRFRPSNSDRKQIKLYSLMGFSLILLDVVLKWVLAGVWQQLLRSLTDL